MEQLDSEISEYLKNFKNIKNLSEAECSITMLSLIIAIMFINFETQEFHVVFLNTESVAGALIIQDPLASLVK